ncbi:Cobalt-zinc-cadmium resistance protein CzcA [Botrimarina colliarenosi]|uniref:Cobalt-zinc-cadmium resistance protein CzcA n=1 Tax=Botrimarina colliarenosi TaxID=2528001 RepID=A0A5C6A0M5_9BACT|nr:efflux RND transporter permease subunit [Botrimarina colliarenosi]TWT92867.1 Cobalt-zinc-cadmium resistance protein CzcA [Botrimarina colliarenosi]
MLNAIIRFSLRNQLLVLGAALAVMAGGVWSALHTPIDVFPDLNRPRVVVMTEAPGLAPEEVESLITFPLETALNGANGVQAVRSASGIGLSVIYVEFDYGTDIYVDRQVVAERLALVTDRMPMGVSPQLAPISSIMGQILMLGMWSEGGVTDPIELRTRADWVLRQRLLTIPGVAQVFTMGGGRKQFQVLVDPAAQRRYGVTLEEVRDAISKSNQNATGGYLDQQGPNELLVRAIGRVQSIEDLQKVAVTIRDGRPVTLAQVAQIIEGPQIKRGDGSAYVREDDGDFSGGPAVILTINKQPGADTRKLHQTILDAVAETRGALGDDVRIEPLYAQRAFIDRALTNVAEALRDGCVLVVIILFAFLLNVRTTFISLTAIPLSLAMTVLVFRWFGLSINTMTLGGLAVAIGELVDDAIVDVENIYRRLNENRRAANPKPALRVVYDASLEVRSSIVFSTIIVCLVFLPLFALSGMEGRLFAPLGIAYVVSIGASLLVSLTVTPVLSYLMLGHSRLRGHENEGPLLRFLKWLASGVIRFSLHSPWLNLAAVTAAVAIAMATLFQLERDFLPPFNEGSVQLNVLLPPGTSLSTSNSLNRQVERRLCENPDVMGFVRRTGRAELDEHAEPVSASEYVIDLDPESPRSREEQLTTIRQMMDEFPGVVSATEQPIAHLISHMLSGVKAQVGIKLFGDDLDVLRREAEKTRAAIAGVPGVRDLLVEQQTLIPQLRVELDRDKLLVNGLSVEQVNQMIETAMNGHVVSEVLIGQRSFDLIVRLEEDAREDINVLRRLPIETPGGGVVPLEAVAKIYTSAGPNVVKREQVRRRIVVQCNVADRGLVDVVQEIKERLIPVQQGLPAGYYFEYSGQFESQQNASRLIGWLFAGSLLGVFLVLYTMFKSVNLALQVMAAVPMAFIGSVAALVLTGQTLTIASIVGFISLAGIASRNGILLLQHYLHLVKYEGESWTHEMILRGGLERLAPVLMTALTAGIALVPLVLAAGEPGKEILYPVATVILGGVISSTLLDFFVHPALFWLFGRREGERVVNGPTDQLSTTPTDPAL